MAEIEDPQSRIEALLVGASLTYRTRFLETVDAIRDQFTLQELEHLLEQGRFDEALVRAEVSAAHLASAYSASYVLAGQSTAAFIANSLSVLVNFDQTNLRAVEQMRISQLRMIREFTEEQRLVTRMAIVEGISQGLNPKQQALLFKESIGLTQQQWAAVQNYRRLLEQNSAESLTRELRDGRFDRTIRGALSTGEPLSATQINRMVERYHENMLRYRAETIARTEALRSVHEGIDESYRQAIEAGTLNADELTQFWRNARDARVRDSHVSMEGQQRPLGQPFLSGDGNLLRYPGDIDAPASDAVLCRCVKTTRFTVDAPVASSV